MEDMRLLVECLSCTLASDVEVRKNAEAKLESVQAAPGYGVALGKIVVAHEVQEGTRQLAAVLLKQYIEKRWQEVFLVPNCPVVGWMRLGMDFNGHH